MFVLWKSILLCALFALLMETFGVATGAYYYGAFPFKVFGVPLVIVAMWAVIAVFSHSVKSRYGILVGVLAAYSLDLLEPIAFYTGAWVWSHIYTPRIYFGSTVGNVFGWLLILYVSILIQDSLGV